MKNILLILTASVLITSCGEPLSIDERIHLAQEQYLKAKSYGHSGNRSSYLPRVGKIKADDYKNCKAKRYYGYQDPHDFCAWHSEIGKWQYRG